MDNKNKAITMFKYIKELSSFRIKTVKDVKNQFWYCFFKDIPDDIRNITLHYRDRVEEEPVTDDVILKVKKPEFQSCPEPERVFFFWLNPEWEKYTSTVSVKDVLDPDVDLETAEHFVDNEERVQAYEKWLMKRDAWTEKQKLIYSVRQFFVRLYQLHVTLERDSEILELMVGDGILTDRKHLGISHPILLKRIKTSFDPITNVICFHDTDTEAVLYTTLINGIEELNYSAVKTLSDKLYANDYHPLDRNDARDFLKETVHSLCPESKFIESEDVESARSSDRLILNINPVFFARRRIDGSLKAIDAIINNIQITDYIPPHLLDIVGGGKIEIPTDVEEPTLPQQLAAVGGEDVDILLSKEANKEQLQIAQRISRFNAVLVQGPPGTGKTHTIANLLGHFLANGNTVLVTSHTKKALSVLKEKVPSGLQDLCVSVLDDSNTDMERSVDGISEFLSKYNAHDLKLKMDAAKRSRAEIVAKLADVRQKIYDIKFSEFKSITFNGESISPSEAARFVYEHSEDLSYIPGKVVLYRPMPLSFEEISALYRSNKSLTTEEEVELECDLPNTTQYPSPAEFRELVDRIQQNRIAIEKNADELGYTVAYDNNNRLITLESIENAIHIADTTRESLNDLDDYLETFPEFNKWMIYAAVDGRKGGGYASRWSTLIKKITDTVTFADALVEEGFGKTLNISDDADTAQLKEVLPKILDLYTNKAKITKLNRMIDKRIEAAERSVKINNCRIASVEDCAFVIHQLDLKTMREECGKYWNELLAVHDVPEFMSLHPQEPEQIAKNLFDDIRRYLEWYANEYDQLENYIFAAGMDSSEIFVKDQLDSELLETEKKLMAINDVLPKMVKISLAYTDMLETQDHMAKQFCDILRGERRNSKACSKIRSAYENSDSELYDIAYAELYRLYEKYELRANRREMLTKLFDVAPEWANAIRERIGIHGESSAPANVDDAWRWKQYSGIIGDLTSEPFEELQRMSINLSKGYREQTANLAEWSAWYHLVRKTESDLTMKQALIGWKLTAKKIGRGTGKNAPMLKAEARKLMPKCQEAVPAWIMPMSRALESFVPGRNEFDIVIVDEASQSDISALAITYMAKKVIIVGDDKQVSPMAIGIQIDKMNALSEGTIKDVLPNWQLYTGNSSLYDISSTVFQPLMLREHFRCVPEIIGFSNKLSYEYKIKPLRDTSECELLPAIVNYSTNGKRIDGRKVNEIEAKTIVAIMMACIDTDEYKGKTFGVISLLGDEQAKLISKLIYEKIDTAVAETRRILCGNPAHFQGDERDVIFLSLVDSNDTDGPLSLMSDGVEQATKKRYNVAVSRAKDQLWVVHSLDTSKDLKEGDMRKILLDYSADPAAFMELANKVEAHAESPFEEAVGKSLIARGYQVIQQWKVGAYRIDMVVVDGLKKVALECDGEEYHSGEEKIREDMERQTILERLGWRFIRIRGSEYYRNPQKTMERVTSDIEAMDIYPQQPDVATVERNSDLLERIKARAAEILSSWSDEDIVTGAQSTISYALLADKFKKAEQAPLKKAHENKKIKTQVEILRPTMPKKPVHQVLDIQPEQTSLFSSDHKDPVVHKPRNENIHKNEISEQSTENSAQREVDNNGVQNIIECLQKAGFEVVNNYDRSSIIWVIDKPGARELVERVSEQCNVTCGLERRGAIVTNNRSAWRITLK